MFNNKYSFLSIARNALNHHENWQKTWNSPEPKKSYDAIIVGGGGHGLTTAYYLAKNQNLLAQKLNVVYFFLTSPQFL